MTDKEVIDLLNHDIEMEHQAILQYLLTGWTIEDLEAPIVEIARDEMRHFKWFAQAVVSLGGEPSMKVPEVFPVGDPVEALKKIAVMEAEAAEEYGQQIDKIPHENIKRLLERIVGDERYHEGKFVGLAEKAERMREEGTLELTELDKSPDKRKRLLWRYLQEDVSGEYAAILRYLHQAYLVEDGKLGMALEDHAIDEMKHMGWVAEEIIESGGEVDMTPDPVKFTTDLKEMFLGNEKLERGAEDRYLRHAAGYDDEEMKELWDYIRFHETHHTQDFQSRLAKLAENETKSDPEPEADAGTEPPAASSEAAKSETSPADEQHDKKATVGSLFRKKQK